TMSDATEAEVEAVAQALAQMARETIAAMDAVRGTTQLAAKGESLRQAAEAVVLDASDEATGPEPDPNLAELAHCAAALAGEPGCSEAEIKAAVLATFVEYGDEAGSGIHSWRCAYPDRYGPCRCREEFAADVAARVAGGVPGRSEAEVKAEALREAADAMRQAKEPGHWNLRDPFYAGITLSPDEWLERRAVRLAMGADQ